MLKRIAFPAVLLFALPGCSVIDTGPTMARTTLEATAGAARSLLNAYQPTEMTANVDLAVNDPRYVATIFFGAGTYSRVELALVGADASFGLASAGAGLPTDREFVKQATAIIGNTVLSEEQRRAALERAVIDFVGRIGIQPAAVTVDDAPPNHGVGEPDE
jgi:hypothetical protein